MIAELKTITKGKVYYSDIPASFSKSSISNDLSASYDIKAIQDSLLGILTTNRGERPFYPEYGCDITNQLFENMSTTVAYAIKNNIKDSITAYEPRVTLKNIVVTPVYDSNLYQVTIEYHIITDYTSSYTTSISLRSTS